MRGKKSIISVIALTTAINCGLTAAAAEGTLKVTDFLDYNTEVDGCGAVKGHWA